MSQASVQVILLCDNSVRRPRLLAEHGLAMWIEGPWGSLLFDTGQTGIVTQNADRLGLNLADLKAIVLSHGHYDHTGGLREVLRRTGPVEVWVHPDVFAPKVARPSQSDQPAASHWVALRLGGIGGSGGPLLPGINPPRPGLGPVDKRGSAP